MPVKIKVCGITRYEDAKIAVGLGVDALGFIFTPKSPRFVTADRAAEITEHLPPFTARVGVFVNERADAIMQAVRIARLTAVQLHGDESPEFCTTLPLPVIKSFSVGHGFDLSRLDNYPVSGLLLDTWDPGARGGTGKSFDWRIAREAQHRFGNVILAGGLGPTNIAEALEMVEPYAVDLNSGVEIRPGEKNQYKMREAVAQIRRHR